MNLTLKKKIWIGFLALVAVFVINAVVIILTESNIQKSSDHISKGVDPAEQLLEDFKAVIIESKMYATNWVFLRYNQEDKDALVKLHQEKYPHLKSQITQLLPALNNRTIRDLTKLACKGFDELIIIEHDIR